MLRPERGGPRKQIGPGLALDSNARALEQTYCKSKVLSGAVLDSRLKLCNTSTATTTCRAQTCLVRLHSGLGQGKIPPQQQWQHETQMKVAPDLQQRYRPNIRNGPDSHLPTLEGTKTRRKAFQRERVVELGREQLHLIPAEVKDGGSGRVSLHLIRTRTLQTQKQFQIQLRLQGPQDVTRSLTQDA